MTYEEAIANFNSIKVRLEPDALERAMKQMVISIP